MTPEVKQELADSRGTRIEVTSIVIIFILALLALVVAEVFHWLSLRVTNSGTVAGSAMATDRAADYVRAFWAAISLCAVFTLVALSLTSIYLVKFAHDTARYNSVAADYMKDILTRQTNLEAVLTQVSENMLLSDAIKSVAFRRKDKQVLLDAIEQDIKTGHWDTAAMLISELGRRFGAKSDVLRLHRKLDEARNSDLQEKLEKSIKHIESLWMIHNYADARREIQQLQEKFPGNKEIEQLLGKTEEKRQKYKQELLDRWEKARQENDVDRGVEILTLLDEYLTPEEAAQLEESAREVFRAKLHNMGVQFSLFVTEKKWAQALKIGRQIMEGYPNSKMAQEVREKIDVLEKRAAGQ